MLLFFLTLVEVIDRLGPVLRRKAFPIIRHCDCKKKLCVREIQVNLRFAVPQGIGNNIFHYPKHSGRGGENRLPRQIRRKMDACLVLFRQDRKLGLYLVRPDFLPHEGEVGEGEGNKHQRAEGCQVGPYQKNALAQGEITG